MSLEVFQYPLKKVGLHIDFLRLRCGAEETFHRGIEKLKASPSEASEPPSVFIAFAEWDAVVMLPCTRLYPPGLNQLYGTPEIATAIAGNAGYFSYLWAHPINDGFEDKLVRFESSGIGTLISLRFEDWVRNKFGLAAELLICDAVQEKLRQQENDGIEAVVANTLGWNDVAVLLHASKNEQQLTKILSWMRILTLHDLLGQEWLAGMDTSCVTDDESRLPIFAASYTHLIGSYEQYENATLRFGSLREEIIAAKLLVRVPASFEPEVRRTIAPYLGIPPDGHLVEHMPSEMGHYSFSANISELAKSDDAAQLINLLRHTRATIGKLGGGTAGTYAETSTVFTFVERQEGIESLVKPGINQELNDEIEALALVLKNLPENLAIRGASPMTIHRFATVMITLLDHLSDPVRSSAVHHAATFIRTLADRIGTLNRESIDDLCQVCEVAIGQAIDGIAQFQHDANSIGLSGRGGYTRLIGAIEMFTRDLFVGLGIKQEPPLITFGLRTGSPGSLDRFQIDIPFRVVFTPSDWYILLHEVGHLCWVESFGWMSESLATYEALSREIALNRPNLAAEEPEKFDKTVRTEFLSTRSIVRELFPNLVVFRLACGEDLKRFDLLSMHHVLRRSSTDDGTRSMLIGVVLHVLLGVITDASAATAKTDRGDVHRTRAWWQGWGDWRARLTTDRNAGRGQIKELVQDAVNSMSEVLAELGRTSLHLNVNDKQKILSSESFRDAAVDAIFSVVEVLALAGGQFTDTASPGAKLFHDVQNAIDAAVAVQHDYSDWRYDFATWLGSGEVFAMVPTGYVWLSLLIDAEEELRPRSSAEFMVSQLSIVLAMWHRAVTSRGSGSTDEAIRKLNHIKMLGYIQSLPPSD